MPPVQTVARKSRPQWSAAPDFPPPSRSMRVAGLADPQRAIGIRLTMVKGRVYALFFVRQAHRFCGDHGGGSPKEVQSTIKSTCEQDQFKAVEIETWLEQVAETYDVLSTLGAFRAIQDSMVKLLIVAAWLLGGFLEELGISRHCVESRRIGPGDAGAACDCCRRSSNQRRLGPLVPGATCDGARSLGRDAMPRLLRHDRVYPFRERQIALCEAPRGRLKSRDDRQPDVGGATAVPALELSSKSSTERRSTHLHVTCPRSTSTIRVTTVPIPNTYSEGRSHAWSHHA